MPTAEDVVRQFNDCINRGDLDALTALMTEDHVFTDTLGARAEVRSKDGPVIWTALVRDGQVAHWRVYPDTPAVRAQLQT